MTVISGLVMDPTGAVVRGASVALIRQSDRAVVSTSVSGLYGVYRLEAGEGLYKLVVRAAGFAPFESAPVTIGPHAGTQDLRVDASLAIPAVLEKIEVPEPPEPTRSGREVVLSGREVRQLPLDPVALKNELMALAGSSSAQIFIDGFSGGRLPPRDSINEIRINDNPYSAENDTDTVTGVIKILTQPGSNHLHGNVYLYGDDSALNAKNPFAPEQPGYYADGAGGEVSDSIGKRTNAYGRIDYLQQNTNAAVNALVPGSGLTTTQASYAVPNPQITLDLPARMDVKVSTEDTAVLRYALHKVKQSNVGVGQLALQSQGLDERSFAHTLQVGNTLVISPKIVDETRFQYLRTRTTDTPASSAPTLLVQGAFTGGGNAKGETVLHQDRVEFQEYVSVALDRHFVSVGGRLRVERDASFSRAHFNGEFVFPNLAAYQTMLAGMAAGWTADQIAAAGGGADQYVVADGDPSASVTLADGAIFAEDNWKLRQNFKLSYGLRFETQNFIGDHADWAPRLGFSWGVGATKHGGGSPRYVVHGGAGVFYQRFGTTTALNVSRFNGTRQVEYVVESPKFCPSVRRPQAVMVNTGCASAPPPSSLSAMAGTTVYNVNPNFRAPTYIEGSLGVDRQLGNVGSVGLTYLQSRGVHTQYAENTNAPLPGTYVVGQPSSGSRPSGNSPNVFEYESDGLSRTRQLTANAAVRSARYWLIGNYTLDFSNSDAESNGTFPLNRFDMSADYGRSAADVRHAGVVTAGLNLPYGITSWATLKATSGAPFNIVVGEDLNGDTQYNDRPAFATDLSRPSVLRTAWGVFDAAPIAGQTIIPRNYGQGPGSLSLDLTVGKVYGFGRQPNSAGAQAPAEPKYSAELWLQALNLLNHPNLVQPVAVLGTPLFGRSVGVTSNGSLSPARALDMQLVFRF